MNMPRFKFNWISTTEMIVSLILLPIVWNTWSTTISNMRYCLELERMLECITIGKSTEAWISLQRAEKFRPDDVTLQLYRAQNLLRQKKWAEARELYQTIHQNIAEYVYAPKIGMIVSDLYALENEPNPSAALLKLTELEKQANSLCQENPNFSEPLILSAQITLQRYCLGKKNNKTEEGTLEQARSQFSQILQENQRIFASNREDVDYLDLFSKWNPPSADSCQSLYVGHAMVAYEKANNMLSKIGNEFPSEKEGQEIVNHLQTAIQSLTSAFFLHPEIHNHCKNINQIYATLFSLPFVKSADRIKIMEVAQQYLSEVDRYAYHLTRLGNQSRASSENVNTGIDVSLHYGLAVSYYYLEDWENANAFSCKVLNAYPDLEWVRQSLTHIRMGQIDKTYLSMRNFFNFSDTYRMLEVLERETAKLPKNTRFSLKEWSHINNYAVLLFLQGLTNKNMNDCKKAAALIEGSLTFLPTDSIPVGVQEDPVFPSQIAKHNLYAITKEFDKAKASKMDKQLLHRSNRKP